MVSYNQNPTNGVEEVTELQSFYHLKLLMIIEKQVSLLTSFVFLYNKTNLGERGKQIKHGKGKQLKQGKGNT